MLQPKIKLGLAAILCSCSLWLSCAHKELSRSEGQRLSGMPARLTVVNSLQNGVQVYLRPELGSEIYLGRVYIGETKTFQIKPPFPLGRSFLVAAQTLPAWSGEPVIAELAEALEAGDTLHWDLLFNHLDWRAQTAVK